MNIHSGGGIHLDKKELIRQSAIDVIAEKGYFNTTAKIIAEKAGIAVGTIYIYFSNKEEILNHIFITEFEKRAEYLEKLINGNYSTFEKLDLFYDFHFKELEKNKNVGTVMLQESMHPQLQSLEGVKKFLNQLPLIFTKILKNGIDAGEIRDLDCDLLATIIVQATRGAIYKIKSSNKEYEYEQVKNELKNFIWQGIKKG